LEEVRVSKRIVQKRKTASRSLQREVPQSARLKNMELASKVAAANVSRSDN
jgi:hypothetical protein